MNRRISTRVSGSRLVGGLLVLPAMGLLGSACGSPSHPKLTAEGDPRALASGPQVPTPGSTGGSATGAASGKSVEWTTGTGYRFRISLASSGVVAMNSFMTDDGTGDGGTSVDAPPGSKILVGEVVFQNTSDRPEPMPDAPVGVMPADATGSQFIMAVPVADASTFGIDSSSENNLCTEGTPAPGDAEAAPVGYCDLSLEIGAFSPAQTDITQPPQLAPGASGTVSFITAPTISGEWVPQNAPVGDVKVFYAPTLTCGCWAPLGQ